LYKFLIVGKLLDIVWNWNRNFTEVGTGTPINHYGYTTYKYFVHNTVRNIGFDENKIVKFTAEKMHI
jgi:hypothetical protein